MDFSAAIAKARELVLVELAPKVPGLSVAVAAGGALVWSESFGWADLDAKKPATRETRFRIGSVSKPLTAAGLALLVERGQLKLDAPVHQHIPDFPQHHAPTTIRMLAGHLTGIRNYHGTEALSNQAFPNLRSGLKIFENDPLEAPPGTRYSYSSYNYNVLGVAMEAAARKDFLSYMDENVIRPLGLSNTVPDRAGVADPQRAQFYEISPAGKFLIAPRVNASYAWPSGGYLSTAEDMVRFGLAHVRPGFLKADSIRLLFTSQVTTVRTGYGIGWFVGGPLAYHPGDSLGGMAVLVLHPPSRTVVALACNAGRTLLRNVLRQGKAPKEAEQLLPNRDTVAVNIAKIFAALFKKTGGP